MAAARQPAPQEREAKIPQGPRPRQTPAPQASPHRPQVFRPTVGVAPTGPLWPARPQVGPPPQRPGPLLPTASPERPMDQDPDAPTTRAPPSVQTMADAPPPETPEQPVPRLQLQPPVRRPAPLPLQTESPTHPNGPAPDAPTMPAPPSVKTTADVNPTRPRPGESPPAAATSSPAGPPGTPASSCCSVTKSAQRGPSRTSPCPAVRCLPECRSCAPEPAPPLLQRLQPGRPGALGRYPDAHPAAVPAWRHLPVSRPMAGAGRSAGAAAELAAVPVQPGALTRRRAAVRRHPVVGLPAISARAAAWASVSAARPAPGRPLPPVRPASPLPRARRRICLPAAPSAEAEKSSPASMSKEATAVS